MFFYVSVNTGGRVCSSSRAEEHNILVSNKCCCINKYTNALHDTDWEELSKNVKCYRGMNVEVQDLI